MLRRLHLLLLVVLVAGACAAGASEDFVADRTNIAAEPTSLADLRGLGGGSYIEMTAEEIAAISEVMLEAVVIDIKKSRLNTADGLFPTGAEIEANGFGPLVVLTDVEVRVVRTFGAVPTGFDFSPGETITVTVGGGMYRTVLDADQIEAIGLASGADTGIEGGVPTEPGSEFVWGTSPDENLSEGDTVMILLARQEIPGFAGSPSLRVLSPTHPFGVFHRNGSDQWVDPRGRVIDTEKLPDLLGMSATG